MASLLGKSIIGVLGSGGRLSGQLSEVVGVFGLISVLYL